MLRLTRKVFRGVLTLVRALGFAPYSLDEFGRCVPSLAWRAYSAICVLFLGVLSFTIVTLYLYYHQDESAGRSVLLLWEAMFGTQLCVQSWALWARLAPRLCVVLNSAAVREGAPRVPVQWVLLVAALTLAFLMVAAAEWMDLHLVASRLLERAACLLFVVYLLQRALPAVLLALLLHCLVESFKGLNASFTAYYLLKRNKDRRGGARTCQRGYIRGIRRKHGTTVDMVGELAFCFGPFMIVDAFSDFMVVVYASYVALTELAVFVPLSHQAYGFLMVLSIISRWWYLLIIASSVCSHGNEALTISIDITQDCALSKGEQHEVHLFLESLFHTPVRVAFLGELDLNISRLFEMSASGIGYIVIMLQFRDPGSKEKGQQDNPLSTTNLTKVGSLE